VDCLDRECCHIGFVASVWKHVAAASSSREWQMLMMELQYQFRPKLNGVPRLYVYRREKRSGNSYTSPQVFLGPQSCALRHRIYNFAIWLPIRSLSILYQVLNPHAQKYIMLTMTDLKNTTDDALPNYLTSLKFKQSHFLTDVRLTLGYSAVIIAAATFAADYRLGWDATKYWTFWAVLVYFTLNGALTFWIWGVEKGRVFTGDIEHPATGWQIVRRRHLFANEPHH